MADVLLKPGSQTGALVGGTVVSTTGTFVVIKAQSIRGRSGSPLFDTTGNDDTTPVWENNAMVYNDIIVTGFAMTTAVIALSQIDNQNPGDSGPGPAWDLVVIVKTGSTMTFDVIMENIFWNFTRNAPVASLRLEMKTTEHTPVDFPGS